jgi:hypothetical protein
MQFSQTTAVPQLYQASDNGDATPGTLLYLLPQGATPPGSTIPFDAAWTTYQGTYIFLEQPLTSGTEQTFANNAWTFINDPRRQGTRFVWFNQPTGPGQLSGINIAVYQPTGSQTYATGFPVTFPFQNVSLFIPAKSVISRDDTNFAFSFTAPTGQAITLSANSGKVKITAGPPTTLPFTGNLAGCLQFSLQLTQQNLTDLDVSLRYYYAQAFGENEEEAAGDGSFFLSSLRYPLFAQGLTLYANLDPLAPINQGQMRTFFAFNGADAGQPSAGQAASVNVYLNSTMGYAFKALPLTGGQVSTGFAALVFAPNQQASAPSAHDPFYLVPSGDFALQPTGSGQANLMGGLSGVEYFALGNGTNLVSFFPGKAAFAQGFVPGKPPGSTKLTPTVPPTTSFALVSSQAAPVNYFAQPDQSVLYNYNQNITPAEKAISSLALVPVQAATIQSPTVKVAFPLLPYSGVGTQNLSVFQQMEAQMVAPARRQALLAAPPVASQELAAASTGQSKYSTTPQGLLATYVPGGPPTNWAEVILAQMGATGDQQFVMLTGVKGDLLTAFQTNKMFLVVSLPSSIQDYLSHDNAQIAIGNSEGNNWNFNLDPAVWSQTPGGTILIVKFYDMSIKDLAGQTSLWSSPATFNQSADATGKAIQGIINAVDKSDPDFATFLNAVTDPKWNGILALNVVAPLNELPAQLQGLSAGIDKSQFFAHHIGINASKINVPAGGGDLGISNSSIFGLINYTAPSGSGIEEGGGDYQFEVEQLKVLFLNSAVAGFSSIIDLQINVLFGEPATLVGSSNNVVQLYGVYQQQGPQGQGSYVFQTKSGQASVFNMTSNVLNAVQISKGQFVTVQTIGSQTEAEFLFWGLLDFKALPGFDLFSFGRENANDQPGGLSFGNLIIEMTFDNTQSPPDPTFTFDAGQLAFDMAGSTARKVGFFNHFPLTVAGLTQAKEGTTPNSLGYMGVQSPLTQASLAYPWYSLNFNLNLGAPGALAAQAGFVASLTAAWTPNLTQDYTVFTGLKLPGSSGSKRQITIEGIFNITFKTLEIIALQESSTFILVLYGIGFKFLSFTFPPTGQVNFVLFGDPNSSTSGGTSVGWYAAYAKPDAKKSAGSDKSSQIAGPSLMLPIDVPGGGGR